MSWQCYLADVQPNTTPWYEWRRQGLGGSDIPMLLGVSPYKDATIKGLALDKLGLVPPRESVSWPARRGQLLEPKARKMLGDRYNVDIYVACVEHRQHRHHRASLDGYWWIDDRLEICELKALKHETHLLFGRVVDGLAPKHALPLHLLVQCQWQLYVSGADVCHLCCYSEKKDETRQLHVVHLTPEPCLWAGWMLPPAEQFWSRLTVLRRVGYNVGGVGLEQFEEDYTHIFEGGKSCV